MQRLASRHKRTAHGCPAVPLEFGFELVNLAQVAIGFDDTDQIAPLVTKKVRIQADWNLPPVFVLDDGFVVPDFFAVADGPLQDTVLGRANRSLNQRMATDEMINRLTFFVTQEFTHRAVHIADLHVQADRHHAVSDTVQYDRLFAGPLLDKVQVHRRILLAQYTDPQRLTNASGPAQQIA